MEVGSIKIETEKLTLVPMTYEFVVSKLNNRKSEIEKNGVRLVKEFWESSDIIRLLPIIEATLQWRGVDGFGPWLIILKKDNRIIGTCGTHDEPDENNEVKIGYDIDFDCRGNGYGTEAVSALVDWLIIEKNIGIISAECKVDNESSIGILKNIGMKEITRDNEIISWRKYSLK